MKTKPRIGQSGEVRFIVQNEHTISFAVDGMPAVLATPCLVASLEKAAREALAPSLEPGENTVGTEIELQHLAATPLGQKVICVARVIQADGKRVAFQLEARDEQELIARGFHRRHVINVDAFAKRVLRKSVQRGTG